MSVLARGLLVLATGTGLFPAPAAATEAPVGATQSPATEVPVHAAEAHGPHAHHVAVFAGATTTPHETAPSVGLDYVFFLPVLDRRLGVGPIADATFGEHLEIVAGLALAARGAIGLQLALAPIVVLVAGEQTFGGRVNVSYALHLDDRWSLGPSASADFLPHDTLYVYGLAGGLGF